MRWTVLAASLCLASAAHAGTLLFLNSQASDYIGQGEGRLITPADGTFTASRNLDNGVSVDFAGGATGDFWCLDFAAPMGATLGAGVYEGATSWPFQAASSPGLSVYGDGRGCNTLTGRFVVLEATYGADGKVESFAADFEQHCESAGPALFGSIRYDAGDPACAGQPDGTACDDRDACTRSDACQGGHGLGPGRHPGRTRPTPLHQHAGAAHRRNLSPSEHPHHVVRRGDPRRGRDLPGGTARADRPHAHQPRRDRRGGDDLHRVSAHGDELPHRGEALAQRTSSARHEHPRRQPRDLRTGDPLPRGRGVQGDARALIGLTAPTVRL